MKLGVVRTGADGIGDIAAYSRHALDRPLATAAELSVRVIQENALVLGAFQRAAGLPDQGPLVRRGSGRAGRVVGPGTIHVALSAPKHPGALTPCDETRIVNRSGAAMLRALTKVAGPAHFFGRDWVSARHHPVAWVGFAHEARSRRTLFEAFVAVRTPFALTERASFLGKTQATLEGLVGRPVDADRLAEAIADAYPAAYGVETVAVDAASFAGRPGRPGRLSAPIHPGPRRSKRRSGRSVPAPTRATPMRRRRSARVTRRRRRARDALLETANEADVGRIVDETLGRPGVALDGVRSLASVADVIVRARRGR